MCADYIRRAYRPALGSNRFTFSIVLGDQVAKATKINRTSSQKASVMLVEDHPVMRHGLSQMIDREDDLQVCGEAASATQAIDLVSQTNPDVVVIDITLEDGDGIELIKDIRTRFEHVKMLVSSMHDESLYAERALRAGAMGYISKEASREEFLEAIREILKGRIAVSAAISNRMLKRATGSKQPDDRSPIETLSDRELTVFEFIGQGLSTRQIAEKLFLSVKTIETYREHIKAKLNIKTSTELVRHAVQRQLEKN